MLEWNIVTGDEKLSRKIESMKARFDTWKSADYSLLTQAERRRRFCFMNMPFEKIKEEFPQEAKQICSSCGESTEIWLETEFSFCDEYGCGMCLCPKCAENLRKKIVELKKENTKLRRQRVNHNA
ncbi:hypothetical protein [Anaerotignum lactatifermentans]|uniref:hypothetical protein n=1 Tax=Anaerotignum lactatifermentans TaxID=160404 RepID=UPI003AB4CAEF